MDPPDPLGWFDWARWYMQYYIIYINIYVSKSREKSYGKTHTRQHPSAAKALFCSVIGVPVCATLACWQVSSMFQSKSVWSLQWVGHRSPGYPHQQLAWDMPAWEHGHRTGEVQTHGLSTPLGTMGVGEEMIFQKDREPAGLRPASSWAKSRAKKG